MADKHYKLKVYLSFCVLMLAISAFLFVYINHFRRAAEGDMPTAGIENIDDTVVQMAPQSMDPAAVEHDGLHSVDCWFEIPQKQSVACYHWPLDELQYDAYLAVVVIRNTSSERQQDPIVYLSGGPGSSTYLEPENMSSWFYWQELTSANRDLVLVDQRGTGMSRPKFHCDNYERYVRDILKQPLSIATEFQYLYEAMEQCANNLSAKGLDIQALSTLHSVNDMQSILTALGYPEWNIVAGSYGTRLGLTWMATHPQTIRSAILDSVYPMGKGSVADWPASIAQSFERLWRLCDVNNWCEETPKELQQRFNTAIHFLNASPQRVSLSLWSGGWPVDAVIDGQRLTSILYQSLYDKSLHETIVTALHEIPQGATQALSRLAENALNSELAPEFSPLIYFAIECKETPQPTLEEYQQAVDAYPEWAWITESGLEHDICPLFVTSESKEKESNVDLQTYASIATPILLLSGGFDPVTPSHWADELDNTLPNAIQWHYPSIGHGVINSSGCVHESIKHFFDSPQEVINQFDGTQAIPCR